MGTELEHSIWEKPVLLSLYKRGKEGETQVREDNAVIKTIIILFLLLPLKAF